MLTLLSYQTFWLWLRSCSLFLMPPPDLSSPNEFCWFLLTYEKFLSVLYMHYSNLRVLLVTHKSRKAFVFLFKPSPFTHKKLFTCSKIMKRRHGFVSILTPFKSFWTHAFLSRLPNMIRSRSVRSTPPYSFEKILIKTDAPSLLNVKKIAQSIETRGKLGGTLASGGPSYKKSGFLSIECTIWKIGVFKANLAILENLGNFSQKIACIKSTNFENFLVSKVQKFWGVPPNLPLIETLTLPFLETDPESI